MILNKKNPNVESQLFTSELEKFRPYQTRLAGLLHKQQDLLSEVVRAFKSLLQEQAGSKDQADIETAQQDVDHLIARFRAARGGWEDVRDGAEYMPYFALANSKKRNSILYLTERVTRPCVGESEQIHYRSSCRRGSHI